MMVFSGKTFRIRAEIILSVLVLLIIFPISGCAHKKRETQSPPPVIYQTPPQNTSPSTQNDSSEEYKAGLNPELWGFLSNNSTPRNNPEIRQVADRPLVETVNPEQFPPENTYFNFAPIPNQTEYQAPSATNVSTTNTTAQTQPKKRSKLPILGIPNMLYREYTPRNDRIWTANHAVNPIAEFHDENTVTIYNIRYTEYRSGDDYTTHYYSAKFNLDEIRSMDIIEVPFQGAPTMAHVEASFGFADGRHIGLSVEGRYEVGESYDPLGGFTNQFELLYLLANERDMIRLATDINKNDVHLYRLSLSQAEVRAVFVDVLNRMNKLANDPEFYHTITNNCTTNIIDHINKVRPKAIPKEYRSMFPGLLDSLLFDLQLIDTSETTFKEARKASKINPLAERYGDSEYFSAGIRQNLY